VDGPVSPPDLHATALHALGIRPTATVRDRQDRPHLASAGQPVVGLF
jgi:hypothetical protein